MITSFGARFIRTPRRAIKPDTETSQMNFGKCVVILSIMITPAANAAEPLVSGTKYCKPDLNIVDRVACAHHVAMSIASANTAKRLRKQAEEQEKIADEHAAIVRKRYID